MYRSRSPWLLRRRIWSASRPRGSSKDKGQSSQLLQQELDRVKTQIEKYNRRDMASFPEVVKARQAVVQCYRYVSTTCLTYSDHAGRTLDCWKEVEQFKNAFAEAEKVRCRGASANLLRNLWLHGSNIVCLASIAALTSPARPLPAVDGLLSPGPCGPFS